MQSKALFARRTPRTEWRGLSENLSIMIFDTCKRAYSFLLLSIHVYNPEQMHWACLMEKYVPIRLKTRHSIHGWCINHQLIFAFATKFFNEYTYQTIKLLFVSQNLFISNVSFDAMQWISALNKVHKIQIDLQMGVFGANFSTKTVRMRKTISKSCNINDVHVFMRLLFIICTSA